MIVSDRGYFTFLACLPFILGVLAPTVPGDVGFGMPIPGIQGGPAPNEPSQILVLLIVGAVIMGTALTIRGIVGERATFGREQAVGLSTSAYLVAKIVVFCVFAVVASAIMTTIVVYSKGSPTRGAVWLFDAGVELFVAVAATCVASAVLGLLLSALARSNMQILLLLVAGIMAQILFSGGILPVTGRVLLDQLSWVMPARWGFAASASTIDLHNLEPSPVNPVDRHWDHTTGAWLLDMSMLAVLSAVYAGLVWWRIRLRRH